MPFGPIQKKTENRFLSSFMKKTDNVAKESITGGL
jgi:hypothetical protein